MENINKENVTRIALYGSSCDLTQESDFHDALKKSGLKNVKNIEMHGVSGKLLYNMTFREKPIITCDDIDVTSLKRTLYTSHAYLGDSDIRAHIESVDITDTNDKQEEDLRQLFKNTCFYIYEMEYDEDSNDKHADYVVNAIIVPQIDEDEADWDWEKIFKLVSEQYKKRLRPFVYIETQYGFKKFTVEYLESEGLIVLDKNGNIEKIKWSGSSDPIREFPILLNPSTELWYNCEYDDKYSVDITGFQPGDPMTCTAMHNADLLMISDKGERYAIDGSYIPAYATPHQSFWDRHFDYSNSVIDISGDVEPDDVMYIPSNITGRLNFLGNRDDKEKSKMRDIFDKTRESNNIKIIEALGYNARNKIKEGDLHYSTVDIKFPDEVDPEHHAIYEHTETEFCKEQIPSVKYHSKVAEPIFSYLLTKEMLENFTTTTHYVYKLTFKLTGVSEAVYTALNKWLAIHSEVRGIDLQPRPGGGLTFVLPPNIDSIKKEFWQPGNSYVLPVWMYGTTLNYLKSIKDEHEIEISDRPDEFGFWNIRKKDHFTINRNPVFQMN